MLMGWNVFQEYPEYQASTRFEENGYFLTGDWWENPDTTALIATGTESVPPLTSIEALKNAAEALEGRTSAFCRRPGSRLSRRLPAGL